MHAQDRLQFATPFSARQYLVLFQIYSHLSLEVVRNLEKLMFLGHLMFWGDGPQIIVLQFYKLGSPWSPSYDKINVVQARQRFRTTLQSQCVNVRKSYKTDTSSAQYGMMSRLALMWRSLVGCSKTGWRRPETHSLPVLHDVSLGQSALTTKTTAGVDVTGCPSLVEDCQQGRPAHSRSDTCVRVHRAWTLSSQALVTNGAPSAATKHDHTEKLGKSREPLRW